MNTYPALSKSLVIWEKSATEPITDEEYFEAAREQIKYFYGTLALSNPTLEKFSPFNSNYTVLGKVSLDGTKTEKSWVTHVNEEVKIQLGVDFSSEKHVFVPIRTQILGSSVGVVFCYNRGVDDVNKPADPQVPNSFDVLIQKAKEVKNRPDVPQIVQSIFAGFNLPETGFWDENGQMKTGGNHWIGFNDPAHPWILENEQVRVDVFGPPIKVKLGDKEFLAMMLAVGNEASINSTTPDLGQKIQTIIQGKSYFELIFNVAKILSFQIKQTQGNLFVPLGPVMPTEKSKWKILVPYVSANLL